MSHIYVTSGARVDLINPRVEDIAIEDIAHHLAHLCRFTGAVSHFYSVAEHAVVLSRLVPERLAYAALHHDDHEYVLGDVSRPLKAVLNAHSRGCYTELAERWQMVIEDALGCVSPSAPDALLLHELDVQLGRYEAQLLMKGVATHPFSPLPYLQLPTLTPTQAKAAYRERHEELK